VLRGDVAGTMRATVDAENRVARAPELVRS